MYSNDEECFEGKTEMHVQVQPYISNKYNEEEDKISIKSDLTSETPKRSVEEPKLSQKRSNVTISLLSESYLATMVPTERLTYFKALSNNMKKEESLREQLKQQAYKKRRRVGTESQFIPEYKLENTKLPKLMLLHFGRTRLLWDWLILLIVAYIAITVPYTAAFGNVRTSLIIVDLCFEFVFVCDIIINFRTTYIESKSARLITNPTEIAKNYLHGWFIVDCLAAIPFEWFYFMNDWFSRHIQYFKLCRLLRLFRILRRVNRYIEYTATLLILMMFSFALLAHWFACVWYVIGNAELKNGEKIGWLYSLGAQIGKPYNNATSISSSEKYISALYFVFTSLTTVGFGNIAPNTVAEKTFSVLVLLLGAIVQSAIFGNMTAVIQKLYAARARFHAKASQIKQFVRHHQIDGELRRRIEDWFISHWSISKGVNTDEMLESFPSELQADISLHLYRGFLTLPCFAHASRGCLRSISLKVKKAYFSPGELVMKEKDAVNAIFFVQRGTIEIVQRDFIVAILGTGDLFGEDISKMRPARRSSGDVRALMYCDILYLTRENIKDVLQHYADFCESFSQNIGLSFDLSTGRARTSTGLGSIVEEAEYQTIRNSSSDSHSSEEESDVSHKRFNFKKKNSKTRNNNNNKIPLWQQKLRNPELETTNSPTTESLKTRLMKIESTTSSSDDDSIISKKNSVRSRTGSGISETSFSENIGHYIPAEGSRRSSLSSITFDQRRTSYGNPSVAIATSHGAIMSNIRLERSSSEKYEDSYSNSRKTRKSASLSFPAYPPNQMYERDAEETDRRNKPYLTDVVIENIQCRSLKHTGSRENLLRKSSSKSLPEMSSSNASTKSSTEDTINNGIQKISKLYNCNTHSYLSVPTVSIDEDDNSSPVIDRHLSLDNHFLDVDQGIYSQCSEVGSYESYRRWGHHNAQEQSQTVTEQSTPTDQNEFDGYKNINNTNNEHLSNKSDTSEHFQGETYINSRAENNDSTIRNSHDRVDVSPTNCNDDHAWAHLATELIKLKKGDVQEMKDDMAQLKVEIHTIKQGMESLTELVRNALVKSNQYKV